MLSFVLLSSIMLSVIMVNVVRPNVVAPSRGEEFKVCSLSNPGSSRCLIASANPLWTASSFISSSKIYENGAEYIFVCGTQNLINKLLFENDLVDSEYSIL